MKSDPAEQIETAGADIADPFAGDFFAGARAAPGDPAAAPEMPAPERPWHAALARVTREEARRSSALAAVEPALAPRAQEALARVLARLARLPEGAVRLGAVGARQMALEELDAPGQPERVVLSLSVEPDGAPVALALDSDFAAALVDRLLGGAGEPPGALRPLSGTERAVVEFICLAALREFNALAGEPLLRLAAVSDSLAAPSAPRFDAGARLLVTTARVEAGPVVGLARLLMGDAALAALGRDGNALLARAGGGPAEKLPAFKRLAADVPLRLRLGETRLRALDLAELGAGDVVLFERAQAEVGPGRVGGRVRVRAGAGAGFVLMGAVRGAEGEGGAPLCVEVESVSGAARGGEAGRLGVEDEGRLEAVGEGAAALEGLLLTVHVELPARRISLEELSRLRVGQVLELGCRPTDPVELVAEDRRVAAGELVDIEGRLGVRITSLYG